MFFVYDFFDGGGRVGVCVINEKSRYKWLILFYMYTGTRRNEAIALEWNDINRTEKLIQIKGTKTETSARNILLTDEVETIKGVLQIYAVLLFIINFYEL